MTPASGPEVSVLLVTYDNEHHIDPCLRALPGDVSLEVIAVDNDSSDGTIAALEAAPVPVRVDAAGRNLGFAAGCNRAAAQATGRYLLLLNTDAILHPGALAELLRSAREHPDAGIWGARAVDEDGTPLADGFFEQPTAWSLFCFASGLSTAFPRSRWLNPESVGEDWVTERPVGMVAGMAALIERRLWETLGGFDEDFWMYGEDVDLSLRAIRAGHRPRMVTAAVVTHEGGGSSSTPAAKRMLLLKGRVTLMRKRWSPWQARLGVGLLVVGVALRGAAARASDALGRPRGLDWDQAFRRRAEWTGGYAVDG